MRFKKWMWSFAAVVAMMPVIPTEKNLHDRRVTEGRQRNEQAIERSLEQSGWINPSHETASAIGAPGRDSQKTVNQ